MPETEYAGLTPNQLVAHNLYLARTLLGLTQEQAAEKLEPYIGKRWSKASWSAAERSAVGERIREFTIDEVYAFSRCFELPLTYFLLPPPRDTHGRVPTIRLPSYPESGGKGEAPGSWLERLFAVDDATWKRLGDLFADAIPKRAQTKLQQTISERLSRYIASTMAEEISELSQWEANLRSLADRLQRVTKTAVVRAVEDTAGEGLSTPSPRGGTRPGGA